MNEALNRLMNAVSIDSYMKMELSEWRPLLAKECQVYVFGEIYLAKRFDQINYKFCSKIEATEILEDNLYALLRFKYFAKLTEEIDKRIDNIVKSFKANIKSTLMKVSLDPNADCTVVHYIPDYCVAFRNGVYNFKDNCWFFKYNVLDISVIKNKMYLYDDNYIITWYFNYDFKPLDFTINNLSVDDLICLFRKYTESNRNYCFELMYNIAHDAVHRFSLERFEHLCQILGYTMLQSFSQYFVMLIGSGQNGKNSLFDGCMSYRLVPRPAANDLDALENDTFVTGSLENKAHNIFLETSAKTYTESKMLKALTGSMNQTISQKNIPKYSSIINCKFVFAGNDQENIKFADNTAGFKRRIQMMEIYYHWDSKGKYLKKGDYYDTSFSDSLEELTSDVMNTTLFVYFAMYGIMKATEGWTKNFKFSYNDWNDSYVNLDIDLKEAISKIKPTFFADYVKKSSVNYERGKIALMSEDKTRLYNSQCAREYGIYNYESMIKAFEDENVASMFFGDNFVYLSTKALKDIVGYKGTQQAFTTELKRIAGISNLTQIGANVSYIKTTLIGQYMRIFE